jgi:hypothetical protein
LWWISGHYSPVRVSDCVFSNVPRLDKTIPAVPIDTANGIQRERFVAGAYRIGGARPVSLLAQHQCCIVSA